MRENSTLASSVDDLRKELCESEKELAEQIEVNHQIKNIMQNLASSAEGHR
jgi:hypothetical protein